MKTVIAKRDKSVFWFFLGLVLISCAINGNNIIALLYSDFRWLGIFFIVGLSIITLISVLCLVLLPNAVIIKEDERLIVYRGVFKRSVMLSEIIQAELAPLASNQKDRKSGDIILRIKTENGEEKFLVPQIKDKKNAVEQVNNLLC